MLIDLNDQATRVLVQEYVNKIVSYHSEQELNVVVHKLIHTFEVVKMAQELIKWADPPLDQETKRHILNAAVLHDIGRCHEFNKGQYIKDAPHAHMGAALLEKYLPDWKIEIETTRYHADLPSDKDPAVIKPVLDYVRDSDMLGNIRYENDHMAIFLNQYKDMWPHTGDNLIIDDEIKIAAAQKRVSITQNFKHLTILNLLLGQILWKFNLKTNAGKKMARQHQLFKVYRDCIIKHVVPTLTGDETRRKNLQAEIMKIFPNEFFMD